MNTVATKYEPGHGKSHSKAKKIKKSFFSRMSSSILLTTEEKELLRVTLEARNEWIETSTNFEYVHEEKLVDYYTYKLKACEARYTYFIKLVKEKGLTHYI